MSIFNIIASRHRGFIPTARYQAVLDSATTEGFSFPTIDEQVKHNSLWVELIDKNIMDSNVSGANDKIDSFVICTNSNGDFGRIDWADPTNIYGAVNSPLYNSVTGFEFDGATNHLTSNNFTLGDNAIDIDITSHGYRGSDVVFDASFKAVYGYFDVPSNSLTGFRTTSGNDFEAFTGSSSSVSISTAPIDNTNYMLIRDVGGTNDFFENGVLKDSSVSGITVTSAPTPFFVGGLNVNFGTLNQRIAAKVQHVWFGKSLNGDVAALNTAFNNYHSL